jgi:2-polyprenyl-3-methyl-5-hydroxy-6-metoxy-1,4-benzoquinol methylase
MKKILTPVIRFALDKVKRNKYIQNLFESPFDLSRFQVMGTYTDAYGNTFELLSGLRSKIRPGWERMLTSEKTDISKEYLSKQRQNGIISVNKILPIIKTFGKSIENNSILEVGCHAGAASFAMAAEGAFKVVGTEFAGYKVESIDMNIQKADMELIEANEELGNIRKQLGLLFDGSEKVHFVDDDICSSSLEANSFDIICSWEVLEHLHDTEKAFSVFLSKWWA